MLGIPPLLLILLFVPFSFCFHCEVDEDFANVQEKVFEFPGQPLEDRNYWRTFQMNYQVYGVYGKDPSNSVISAGLYTAEDKLIYSISVDCAAESWKSEVVAPSDDETDTVVQFRTGELETPCTGDAEFDIWLKSHQPHMMSWLFSGQALQSGTQKTHFLYKERTRPLQVTSKYKAIDATKLKVRSSNNGAAFTRITLGQCNSWPRSLTKNCYEARKWVSHRSKMLGGYDDVEGKGHFGANMPLFAPVCYFDSQYYNFLQNYVHPDRNSRGKMYCCCVDMETAEITFKSNKELDCDLMGSTSGCDKSCSANANHDAMQEAIIEYNQKQEEADQN